MLGVMKQTALLEFESSAFPMVPDEDKQTNPGIYGKALAQWIAEQLATRGFSVGEVIAEDFGWCVPIEAKSPRLYVACASANEKPNHWRVFAFAEGGVLARLFGKDTSTTALAALFTALKHTLQSSPVVQGLRDGTA